MSKKILVLKDKMDRVELAAQLRESGAKVSMDSGGRVLVVDVPDDGKKLRQKVPGSGKLLEVDADIKRELPKVEESDVLFIDAFKLRQTKAFIEEKKQRKPGETPEEKELLSAPDYLGDEE